MKKWLVLLASAMLLAVVVACGDDGDGGSTSTPDASVTEAPTESATEAPTETPTGDDGDSDVLRIGALLPTSGALQSYGENSAETLAAALEVLNAEGDRTVE